MTRSRPEALIALLHRLIGHGRTEALLEWIWIPAPLHAGPEDRLTRSQLAMALNLLLFEELLHRVPWAQAYVLDQAAGGRKIIHDHGALRTVRAELGALPPGKAAFARILGPLGYALGEAYPMERLAMTGYAFRHRDLPQELPQFFVSELHPERFSPAFQAVVASILGRTRDPLPPGAQALLDQLDGTGFLEAGQALSLLPDLVACFGRHHPVFRRSDYEVLLQESPEMAWIATEGNAFNHATDRVPDVGALAEEQRALGRPLKDRVEVSVSGRVLQTAFRAAEVERVFLDADGHRGLHRVPGSFFEFITRLPRPDGELDLHFDAGNAQGIFKMTAAAISH